MSMVLAEFAKRQVPFLGSALISEQSYKQLLNFFSHLPLRLYSPSLLFELVLNQQNRRVDFGFALDLEKSSLEQIATSCSTAVKLRKNRHWANFISFLKVSAESEVYKNSLKEFWMFFDFHSLDDTGQEAIILDPNVYFLFRQTHNIDLIESVYSFFSSKQLSQRTQERCQRCYEICKLFQLHVGYVGLMNARSLDSIRFYIAGNHLRARLRDFLAALDYPCDITPVHALLQKFDSDLDVTMLGIDVGGSVHDRIGIECRVLDRENHSFVFQKRQWLSIFAVLRSLNIASCEQEKALANWIGGTEVRCSTSTSFHVRSINSLKFVFDKSGTITTKIYLEAEDWNPS
ncbi:MAG: hypothetical protein ACHQT8_02940 [Chlamydiales bacterium]